MKRANNFGRKCNCKKEQTLMPVVDALKGFFAGHKDVGHRESDIHHTLTLSHTLSLEFLHFLWICWDYHLSETIKK